VKTTSILTVGRRIYTRHGVLGITGAAWDYLTRPIVVPFAIRALRRAAERAAGPSDLIDLALDFRLANIDIRAMQVRSEITALAAEVLQLKPRTVLEIGTARGGTLFLWAGLAAPDAMLVSVDLPFGEFGGGYPSFKVPLFRSFARDKQNVALIRGNSHASQTIALIKRHLSGRPVDFLFIDGDHSYEGVAADFEAFSGLVRPGGLIAFHDVVPGRPEAVGGVPRYWQQLKQQWKGEIREFVESWTQGGLGIGTLRTPLNSSDATR
jgi:cephalosporin hydroxylase